MIGMNNNTNIQANVATGLRLSSTTRKVIPIAIMALSQYRKVNMWSQINVVSIGAINSLFANLTNKKDNDASLSLILTLFYCS